MKRQTRTAGVVGSISVLILTGCVEASLQPYVWPMVTRDNCGEIVLENPGDQLPTRSLEYPQIFYTEINPENDSYVPPVFSTSIKWRVENIVDDNRFVMLSDPAETPLYGYGVPTLPVGWVADVESELGEDSFFRLLPGEDFVYGFLADGPAQLTPTNGSFVYESSAEPQDLVPFFFDQFNEDPESQGVPPLPFLLSFFHLPTTVIVTCEDAINLADFNWIDQGQPFPLVTPPRSSTKEVYPGYVPGLIDFQSAESQVSFASTQEDNRIPIAASIVPWFSGYFDFTDGIVGGAPIDFEQLGDFEQFWLSQLMFAQFTQGGTSPEALEVHAFMGNFGDDPTVLIRDELPPLTKETYLDLYYGPEDGSPDRQEFAETLGNLEYLFLYTAFIEQVDQTFDLVDPTEVVTTTYELTYSFERYYPGAQGEILSPLEFIQEQANFNQPTPYLGPILKASLPTRTKPGQQVTLTGERLADVEIVEIDSQKAEILSKSNTQLTIKIPTNVGPGLKNVVVTSSSGKIIAQSVFTVTAVPQTSIKAQGKSRVQVEIKNPVGLGTVSIVHNGKRVASMAINSESDSRLKNGRVIRELTLRTGRKNVIEIWVDGEKVRQVTYRR